MDESKSKGAVQANKGERINGATTLLDEGGQREGRREYHAVGVPGDVKVGHTSFQRTSTIVLGVRTQCGTRIIQIVSTKV